MIGSYDIYNVESIPPIVKVLVFEKIDNAINLSNQVEVTCHLLKTTTNATGNYTNSIYVHEFASQIASVRSLLSLRIALHASDHRSLCSF